MMARQIELEWPAEKQPGDILDYSVDVSAEMNVANGDTVSSVAASIKPSGTGELAIGGRVVGLQLYAIGGIVTVWLSGGVPGRSYIVRLLVTLSNGKVLDIMGMLRVSRLLAVSPMPTALVSDFSTPVVWTGP
jgi:hypothetical protein